MRRSIRWRLQLWYGLILVAAVGGLAGILYAALRSSRLREVDDGLAAAAQYLDAVLRTFPLPELAGNDPIIPPRDGPPSEISTDDRPPDPPFDLSRDGRPADDRPTRPPPPPRDPRRLLAELDLPSRGRSGPPNSAAYFAVWRHDGSLIKENGLPEGVGPVDGRPIWKARLSNRGDFREVRLTGPQATQIVVGQSLAREYAELRGLAWLLLGASAAAVAVGLLGGWLISARLLRPVGAIAATASSISASNLSQRIDAENIDQELAGLAQVLNNTFARLEAAFDRQARFTADASHELRTPLAIVKSHAELALARSRPPEEYRDALQACLRAATRMAGLVDALLTLARADAGKLDLGQKPVDLRPVVAECVQLVRPLAQAKGISVHAELASVTVVGDASRLAQVVSNLIDNAIQYNRPSGEVRVRLVAEGSDAVLSVADTGCGIPEADQAHIFERFYRADKARSRATGGNGLGLAIAKSIVDAHGGTIGFESQPSNGTRFWVRLRAIPG